MTGLPLAGNFASKQKGVIDRIIRVQTRKIRFILEERRLFYDFPIKGFKV